MTATAARVCVVIPAFDAEAYLLDAARSVLAQTHPDLRLVIVDDGSSDRTRAVAESIRDPRVLVVGGPNRGRAHARNAGWSACAPAQLVAFLDADDLWDQEKLASQLRYLDSHPEVAAVGCFMRYISSTGRVLGHTGQQVDAEARRSVSRAELAPFPISSVVVVRQRAMAAIGGFDESLREAEDLDFLARLAQRWPIGCVPEILGSYRIHPRSAMARQRFRVNAHARFIRARLRAREAGADLSWEEYDAAHRVTWRERRQDLVEYWYRSAALWHGEGRPLRALGFGALAAMTSPRYTLRRVYRQRVGGPS